jgi:ribosomal protein S18 acetylase RimI-like enzyme
LFFDHFHTPCPVAVDPSGTLAGFLVGLLPPGAPEQAYVLFGGVAPAARRDGLARTLYATFFALAADQGRRTVRAITSPVNAGSIAFHRELGFTVTGPVQDYNGPGQHLMVFDRLLP